MNSFTSPFLWGRRIGPVPHQPAPYDGIRIPGNCGSSSAVAFTLYCCSVTGGPSLGRVLGCLPLRSYLSGAAMPLNSTLPLGSSLHGCVSNLGAVSLYAPQAEHQTRGLLSTTWCLSLPPLPDWLCSLPSLSTLSSFLFCLYDWSNFHVYSNAYNNWLQY